MSQKLCGGSVVVDLLFNTLKKTSHCLWEFCVCLCFVMHYFVSILVGNHLEEEEKAGCFAFIV